VRTHVRSRATTVADTFDTDGVPMSCSRGSESAVVAHGCIHAGKESASCG
jgi:hypothetical protein